MPAKKKAVKKTVKRTITRSSGSRPVPMTTAQRSHAIARLEQQGYDEVAASKIAHAIEAGTVKRGKRR